MIPENLKNIALNNLLLLSRTANGVVDLSSSDNKKDIMLVTSGDVASELAINNYINAINFAWDNKDTNIQSPKDIKNIIEQIAKIVTSNILKENNLIRSEDSPSHAYTYANRIQDEMEWFYNSLYDKLSSQPIDIIEAAAFVEYEINIRGHFFADGCGKTGMCSSAWLLFSKQHSLPIYKGGFKTYYKNIPHFIKEVGEFTQKESEAYLEFLNFYKSLF